MDVLTKRNRHAFDLGPGEPVEVYAAASRHMQLGLMQWSRYPAVGGEKVMVDSVRGFLRQQGLPYTGRIIVTNGAKQALGAAIWEMCEKYRLADQWVPMISHWGPFWPTLRSLAKLNGTAVGVIDAPENADIVTSPNNPDGRVARPSRDKGLVHPIWDAAYASPAYGWDGYCVPSRVQVYSMAKLFGVPGMRVGWVHTEDEAAAEFIESYVEVQTSGVNQHSQNMAAGVLQYFTDGRRYRDFCDDVRRRLAANRGLLESALRVGHLTRRRDTGEGMYLFVKIGGRAGKPVRDALKSLDVGYVSGEACGLTEKNLYRFNLAQSYEVVGKLASALEAILET